MQLNRRFTPFSLLLLSINGMVGSAWLFAPLYATKIAGTGALIAWILGGALTAVIALTFAELSVLLPVAGGTAQIPNISHGVLTSFMLGWIAWLSSLTMAPIEVQAVLQYASTYFSSLTQIEHGIPVLTATGLIWATILMLSLCIINIASFKGLIRFNFIIFSFKVFVILITIFMLITVNFHPGNFTTSDWSWHNILVAVASGGIAFAFTGFKHGVELAGEARQSNFAIPLALIGSIVCCLLMYMGLQVAFIGALNPATLANGWANLSFSGDVGPFAGLAAGLGLFWLLKLLYADAVVSPLGAGLIYVTSTARILYAMSQIGYFPEKFRQLNKHNLPVWAVFFNFVIGMFLFLPLPGWQAMVSFLVSAMVISYAMGPIAVLCLRLDLPKQQRQFKIPFVNFFCLLAFYFCNLLSYWTGWHTIMKLAIAMVIGFAFFMVAWWRGKIRAPLIGMKSALWIIPYFSGLVLISYLGAFEGKNIIAFGWDFLVIGIFSLIILYLAVMSRSENLSQVFAQQGELKTITI